MKIVKKKLEDLKVGDVLVSQSGRKYEIVVDCRYDCDNMPFELDKEICGDTVPEYEDYEYEGIKKGDYFNVLDTTEQEKKIIEIEGVKYEVTKDGDGWSKPVRVQHKKGDVVQVMDLKVGDKVLVNVFIDETMIKRGAIKFNSRDEHGVYNHVFLRAIYNGSADDGE